ncbi:MAG: prolipoprotein diacylglyceryl transferase, partial [Candidatus Eremiobacteraeota bacterium]|nr:prolipoprotein diacylglyceryl transferase [Candidatus Eremiobacteraeota bacterium]
MHHWFTYPNINPIAVQIGPIAVHWYGLSYLAGFILVFLWLNRPAGRRRLGLSTEEIQDFLVYALLGVLIGGRAFFVIADIVTRHTLSDYTSNP